MCPAQLTKGEKVLKIVDFIDKIVPQDDEQTPSDGENTKIRSIYTAVKVYFMTNRHMSAVSQSTVGR